MEIEEIQAQEKIDRHDPSESVSWNGHKISSFEERRIDELFRLKSERPSKTVDPQGYYTYRAREEQVKYELDIRNSGIELVRRNVYDSLVLYGHAINHLKRRGEYEEKVYAIWLARVRGQENPPTPDIVFINQGISQVRLV